MTLKVKIGEDIILYSFNNIFQHSVGNIVEITSITDTNTGNTITNNGNSGYYFTDNNGEITIPNVVSQAHLYKINFTNKNNYARTQEIEIFVQGTDSTGNYTETP